MAKKTLDQFNVESDAANGVKRALLSISQNHDEIHYETGPSQHLDIDDNSACAVPSPAAVNQGPAVAVTTVTNTASLNLDTLVPDAPVSALDSVRALLAHSLKRPESEIKLEDSIRILSRGRSTVQNEIIGDMLEEFGPLPEDVENVPLKELASMIQKSYDGKLRKWSRTRIEKMMASKMPGSFGLTSLRSYLSKGWGLASGRQDAVLLRALSQQPAARINKTEDAQAFFDGIAQVYMDGAGFVRPTSDAAAVNHGQILLDSKVLDQLRGEHTVLKKKIAALLTDDENPIASSAATQDLLLEIQAKLDIYEAELGEDFCNGIKPIFNAEQARSYDSTWNWAHVDLLILFYKCLGTQDPGDPSFEELVSIQAGLRNRWNPRLRRSWNYLLESLSARRDSPAEVTRKILDNLEAAKTEDEIALTLACDVCDVCDRAASCSLAQGANHSSITRRKRLAHKAALETGFDSLTNGHHLPLGDKYPSLDPQKPHPLRVLRRKGASWVPHEALAAYMNRNHSSSSDMFFGKNVLVTGAGPSSIGMAMLPSLLQGGARVAVTTSRPMSQAGPIYQRIFASHGGNGSKLIVLPCNQGSKRDIEDLVTHIYDPVNGLGWDLDFVIPFAALSEKGREIDNLDSHSELAHRAMLTNVLRLMGAIKIAKEARDFRTRPAQVLLPLSPNVGTFGNDGLYSESKIGLVAVLNKWSSESWSDYLSVCGVTIGWTRGTGLMADNDWLAKQVAKLGITTFSTEEMAYQILRLMSDSVASVCQNECLVADISGGMAGEIKLAEFVANLRRLTHQSEEIKHALAEEEASDMDAIRGNRIPALGPISPLGPLVNLELGFPGLPDYARELQALNIKLNGMADLESTVVVVGFAELGPWGNSRTRWEMELNGELSIQGCIELAWMTGLMKYNKSTAGWIDAASGTPIKDSEVKANYEKRILENVGLRFINPSPLDHPSRDKKQILQEVVIQKGIEPFATSHDTAMEFVREHGDKVEIQQIPGSDEYSVRFLKGAVLMIPKATIYDRIVGGQIPTGWDPQVYGLPQDICESVDRCTLFALVCAAEAFLSAGITDVYELYRTLHVSELGNCVGSGMGGGRSLQKLFVQHYLDRPVQNDILAETFINTTGAWLNMLLMSSAGPTRTPVGACATALESLNQGYDLIVSGAAKVCLVGGFDDMTQAMSDEFANMRATNNSLADMNRGRAPHEMSRPCASSRCGFVESEGCGMQVITSAKVALELGLPIRAIIAHVQTASDGVGRSVPAPGKGIMTSVSESSAGGMSPLLDISYRRRLLEHTLKSIRDRNSLLPNRTGGFEGDELSVLREEREARRRFGNGFWTHDPRISPLRGALAVWGLTADDIAVVSMHGTSTEMNEKNEVEVLHRQLSQLGRSTGNAALAVCQKYLTGHPKGPAAAWMLNGCCQILDTGIVPGNRNADNIDIALEPWEHLVFPDRSISIHEVKAFSMTSFGFGQKGAQALGVHPKFLFATLDRQQYDEYCRVRQVRYNKAQQHFQNAFYGGRMVTLKDEPPYPRAQQVEALIDASSRFG
jgi:fatty acid synthase subunit alpha